MADIASPTDDGALSPRDGDVGSQPVPARRGSQQFLRFIRLSDVAEVRDGEVSFPPGTLSPYTSDLRRVRDEFDAAGDVPSVGLLAAIATLYERIAFAPGGAGREVADAYNEVKNALDVRGSDSEPTRLCSRCRKAFPAPNTRYPARHEEWWLCPTCHDRLIGNGSRACS